MMHSRATFRHRCGVLATRRPKRGCRPSSRRRGPPTPLARGPSVEWVCSKGRALTRRSSRPSQPTTSATGACGFPVSQYCGEIRLNEVKAGTELVWSVTFEQRVPGTGRPLGPVIRAVITRWSTARSKWLNNQREASASRVCAAVYLGVQPSSDLALPVSIRTDVRATWKMPASAGRNGSRATSPTRWWR